MPIKLCKKELTSVLGNGILKMQIKLGKENNMNREEILKKAQYEKEDEREIQVKDKSMLWSYIAMVFAAGVFSIVRSEQGLPMMDLTATVGFSVLANNVYRFIKTREKQYLVIGLIMLSVTIMATIRFAMGH